MLTSILDNPIIWRIIGILSFTLYDKLTWEWYHYIEWIFLMFLALSILGSLVLLIGEYFGYTTINTTIPPGTGKAGILEEFELIDRTYITINKLVTCIFTYQVIHYTWYETDIVQWSFPNTTSLINQLAQILLTLVCFYVIYDFGYTLFHWGLHHGSIYRFVHKHHHRNCVPFRGNLDAINVHPFEFITGEYNHLFAIHLTGILFKKYSSLLFGESIKIHIGVLGFFIIIGGILASFNHTRYAIALPLGLFQVAYHDVHHAKQMFNYGQYTMFWDRIFGTFKAHDLFDEYSGKINNNNSKKNSNNNSEPSLTSLYWKPTKEQSKKAK